MAVRSEQAPPVRHARGRPDILARRGRLLVLPALLLVIWGALPLVPEESGFRFGFGFQLFFTVCLVLSAGFFWFLSQERLPAPSSGLGVFASVAGVYLATIGFLVAVAMVSPQFGLPQPGGTAASEDAVGRGQALFSKAEVGCFLCHTVSGRGGTRGPDLTHVAERAGERVSGLSAEQYLLEKLKAGATYEYKVPEYVPIMPAFGHTLSEEQLADLVAYLLSLK
ncbi:MAG: cytochrome c [Chloroflexi bacterium]|nr:cytochrome c [Chloroflexota bacterium]